MTQITKYIYYLVLVRYSRHVWTTWKFGGKRDAWCSMGHWRLDQRLDGQPRPLPMQFLVLAWPNPPKYIVFRAVELDWSVLGSAPLYSSIAIQCLYHLPSTFITWRSLIFDLHDPTAEQPSQRPRSGSNTDFGVAFLTILLWQNVNMWSDRDARRWRLFWRS